MGRPRKGAESNNIIKTIRINEILEKKIKEYKITGTIIRDLIAKNIENIENELQIMDIRFPKQSKLKIEKGEVTR